MKKKVDVSRAKRGRNKSDGRAIGHIRDQETAIPGLPVFNNRCFGCSPINRSGLQLNFREDREHVRVECTFRVAKRFEGPPGHVHGGIIATILDEAMGKVNRQKGVVALTRRMAVDYLKPIPIEVEMRAFGWHVSQDGRKHFHEGEIRAMDGTALARSEGLFIAIDPVKMFRKRSRKVGEATEWTKPELIN